MLRSILFIIAMLVSNAAIAEDPITKALEKGLTTASTTLYATLITLVPILFILSILIELPFLLLKKKTRSYHRRQNNPQGEIEEDQNLIAVTVGIFVVLVVLVVVVPVVLIVMRTILGYIFLFFIIIVGSMPILLGYLFWKSKKDMKNPKT
jgi:flagellar biosynthesis protein FlhB